MVTTRRTRRSPWPPARGALLAATASLALSGCARDALPTAASEQAQESASLWDTFMPIAVVIGVGVWGLIAYAIIRYRRRSDDVPSQRQYFTGLEVAWTLAPLAIVGFLWFVSWQATDDITAVSDDPDVEIEVIGFQWSWQFRYLEHGVVTDEFRVNGEPGERPAMVVPTGQTVRLHLVSNDVVHSFWVPDFLEKRDLIPDVENRIDLNVDDPGTWRGQCAEYCGLDHWKMFFEVRAVPPDEFARWVTEQEQAAT